MRVQAEDGIVKLAMEDLVKEGVFSDIYGLGYEYVRVTENTTKLEKEEPKAKNKKNPDRNKKFRQQQKAAKIKARKEAKINRHNKEKITNGFEH